MNWIELALGAALLWGIGNILSKYSLSKLNKETAMIAMTLSSFITVLVLSLFFPIKFSVFPLLSGLFWYVAYYLFFVGLDDSEVSRASALLLTNPIFTAIFSAILLGEILTPTQYLGIILAVLGSMLLTFEGKLKTGALLVIFSSILFSFCDVISKIALRDIDPISTLFWMRFMAIPVFVVLFILWRPKIDFVSAKLTLYSVGTGILSDTAGYMYLVACALTFVSLVTAFTTTQAVYVFIGAIIISKIRPSVLNENTSKQSIIRKVSALALLVLGVVLVAL